MSTIMLRAMLKSALRDKISLFYAAAFPALLMIGLGTYVKSSAYHTTLLLGSLALGTVFWSVQGIAFQVLQQRNRGVYKLLQTTPMKVSSFVLNMTLARTLLGVVVNGVVLAVGMAFFHMSLPVGSVIALMLTLTAGSLAFSCLGFVVVNLARNEGQINMISNLIYIPMVFGSQAFYSLKHVPSWLAATGNCFPFEHFVDAMHAIVERTRQGWPADLITIAGFAIAFLVLSSFTFRYDNDSFRFGGYTLFKAH